MKTVKLFSLGLLLMTTAVFTGCDKDDDPVSNSAITVADNSALTQNIFADETSGKSGVTFTTTGAWTSSVAEVTTKADAPQSRASGVAWISISPDHGDAAGNYTIAITLEPNTSGTDRTAVIAIVCGDTEITVTVAQKGTKEDGTIPAGLTQEEIVQQLLDAYRASDGSTELSINISSTKNNTFNEKRKTEVNRTQKKFFSASYKADNTIWALDYVEDSTYYEYLKDGEETKSSHRLTNDYWTNFSIFNEAVYLANLDEAEQMLILYAWTTSGNVYTGTRTATGHVEFQDEKLGVDSFTETLTVTFNADGKIQSVKSEADVKTNGEDFSYIQEQTFIYSNVNPAFPAGFNKSDFPAELAQDEIVDLLTGAVEKLNNAPEVAINCTRDGSSSILERNVNQKRFLERDFNATGALRYFDYVENQTRYEYDSENNSKRSSSVDADYWEKESSIFEYEELQYYTWTVSGNTFTGTGEDELHTATFVLNENRQIVSMNVVDDDPGEDSDEYISATFSYDNVNPAFPAGFDKADFTEYSAYGGNGAFTNTMAADQPLAVDGAEFTGSQIRFYKDGVDMADALYFDFGSPEEWVSGNSLPAGTYQFHGYDDIAPDYWFYCQKGTLGGINYYGKGGTVIVSVDDGIYTIEVDMDTYHEYYDSPTTGKIRGTYVGYLTMRNR